MQRSGRVVAGVGTAVWALMTIWIAFLPLDLGWKLFFVALGVMGCLNWFLIFLGRRGLFPPLSLVDREPADRRENEDPNETRDEEDPAAK